jgi:hypothetical protein
MKYDEPELYERLEKSIEEDHNLIINNGSTRIYSSTIAATTEEAQPAATQEAAP